MIAQTPARVCAARTGDPYEMQECGQPITFMTADMLDREEGRRHGGLFSGWYHNEPQADWSHWPVPKHEL